MITKKFIAPIKGKILDITNVEDEVFSDKIMGDGFAIDIEGPKIVAPFDGVVRVLFPGGHAVCIESDEGIQVLLHIGLDTHHLAVSPYKIYTEVDKRVKAGELLIEADYKRIKKKAKSSKCPIVFLKDEKINVLKMNQFVDVGEENIVEIEKCE